jgi:hypothetical protein
MSRVTKIIILWGINPIKLMGLLAIALILIMYCTPVLGYSVGTNQNTFTIGSSQNVFTVGEYSGDPISPLDSYPSSKIVVLVIPGLLLLGFIVLFGWMGFQSIKQNDIIIGLSYSAISFLLIGITLLIGMPLIINGINSIIWFK